MTSLQPRFVFESEHSGIARTSAAVGTFGFVGDEAGAAAGTVRPSAGFAETDAGKTSARSAVDTSERQVLLGN